MNMITNISPKHL